MHQALSLCTDREEPAKPIIYKQIISQTHLRKRFLASGYASGSVYSGYASGSARPMGYQSGYRSGSASVRPSISLRGSMGGSFTRMPKSTSTSVLSADSLTDEHLDATAAIEAEPTQILTV